MGLQHPYNKRNIKP